MSLSYFPGNWSECGSSESTGPTLDFPKQPSIESFFPAYKSESETDGSTISESNKTTLAAAQLLSYSIESFFPAYKSESSVSNEPTPDFSKQLSIPSFFPPDMSESDTNENYETQFSYSIVSFFPPARSSTYSSEYYEKTPTGPSISTTIDSDGYIFDKFWSSLSVPMLDLNSSESSLDPLTPTFFTITIWILVSEIFDFFIFIFLISEPLRYLRWLKKSLLKRTIAISSTTQK